MSKELDQKSNTGLDLSDIGIERFIAVSREERALLSATVTPIEDELFPEVDLEWVKRIYDLELAEE